MSLTSLADFSVASTSTQLSSYPSLSSFPQVPPPAPEFCAPYYKHLYLTLVPSSIRSSYRRKQKSASSSVSKLRRCRSLSPTPPSAGHPSPTLHYGTTKLRGLSHLSHNKTLSLVSRSHRAPLLPLPLATPVPSSMTLNLETTRLDCHIPTAMGNSIPDPVKAVIRDVFPEATVLSFKVVATTSSRRISHIRIQVPGDDGARKRILAVSMPPPRSLRLLRSENWFFENETSFLRWFWEPAEDEDKRHEDYPTKESVASEHKQTAREKNTQEVSLRQANGTRKPKMKWRRAVPHLYHYHKGQSSPTGGPYLLLSTAAGEPLKSVRTSSSDYLAKAEHNLGELVANIALVTSPNKRYGPAVAVFNPPDREKLMAGAQGIQYTGGASSWILAFQSYMESVLRDGEDMAVHLPYGPIRFQMKRLAGTLMRIRTPRLFFCNLSDEAVTIVQDSTNKTAAEGEISEKTIVTISDVSTAFFGDPLLSTVFSGPSPNSVSFLQGFTKSEQNLDPSDPTTWRTDLIEDVENAYARVLLYRCLHAAIGLVREYYRPSKDRNKKELAARRQLSEALSSLDKLEVIELDILSFGREVTPEDTEETSLLFQRQLDECFMTSSSPTQEVQARRPSGIIVSPAKRTKVEE